MRAARLPLPFLRLPRPKLLLPARTTRLRILVLVVAGLDRLPVHPRGNLRRILGHFPPFGPRRQLESPDVVERNLHVPNLHGAPEQVQHVTPHRKRGVHAPARPGRGLRRSLAAARRVEQLGNLPADSVQLVRLSYRVAAVVRLDFDRRANRRVPHVEVLVDDLAARHALSLLASRRLPRSLGLRTLVGVEAHRVPSAVVQAHRVGVVEKLGYDHLALANLVVHDAAEENVPLLRAVRRGGGARPRARRHPRFFLLLPSPRLQVHSPKVAVRRALLHVPVVALAVARELTVAAVHPQRFTNDGEVRSGPRAGTLQTLGAARHVAAEPAAPRHRLQRELPHVVVVPDVVAGVVESAEEQQRFALWVGHHPVAASSARADFRRYVFPRVFLEVEPPQVPVVVELLLVRGGELPAEHVEVAAVHDSLVRAPGRRRVGRDHLGPSVAIDVVPEEIPEGLRLAARVDALAAEHDDLRGFGFLRERRGERAVAPRTRLRAVLVHIHLRQL